MKRRLSFLLVLTMILTLLSSCGTVNQSGGKYSIYEIDTDGTSVVKVAYDLKSDDVYSQVQEMLTELQRSATDAEYQQTLPSSVSVNQFTVEDGSLVIDFSSSYLELTDSQEPLIRAAIGTTLCQLDGVDNVSFSVDGQPLVGNDGNQVGAMTPDSFIVDFTNRVKTDQTASLTLYYASKDGNSLVQETREVEYNSNTPLAKVVLSELMKSPDTQDAHPAISSDVNVTGYALSEGICYLTIDAGIQNQSINVSDEVAIYAIVNSLTELDSINKVQITVEGENENAVQTTKLSGLYERNMNMVSAFAEEETNEE